MKLFSKARHFFQKVVLKYAAAVLFILGPFNLLNAAAPPSESVLVIYTNITAYNISLANAFMSAFAALPAPPTVSTLILQSGDIGIASRLMATYGVNNLSQWCQVYDLRFLETAVNVPYTGPNTADVITFSGANNDTQIFTNYLNQNGHLFLQGEHHDFYIRDQNLFAFINAVASAPIAAAQTYADVNSMNTGAIGGFPASPMNFNNIYNNISAGIINAGFPGGLEVGLAGSGKPIGAFFTSQTTWSQGPLQGNTAYAWMSGDLNTNGRMVVNFETNAFQNPGAGSVSDQWIQNVYALLSGCYRYTLTKAFVPTELCVGDSGTFTLCYNNSSTVPLTNINLWDTLPPCLSYVSDSLGTATSAGQVYNWNFPSIAVGASACVTVNFTVSSFACP